jgi:hypothetical protein
MLSVVAGGLQGMVIGLQIALLAILGAIPTGWFGSLPFGEPRFNTLALAVGALAGATIVVVAILVGERKAGRR